jgi:hypothetical protein
VIAFLAALLKKTGAKEDVLRMKPKFIRQVSKTIVEFVRVRENGLNVRMPSGFAFVARYSQIMCQIAFFRCLIQQRIWKIHLYKLSLLYVLGPSSITGLMN